MELQPYLLLITGREPTLYELSKAFIQVIVLQSWKCLVDDSTIDGKAPFFATIWRICLELFPTTEQANPNSHFPSGFLEVFVF